MNPVRACIVNHPGEYRWSSYQINCQRAVSKLIRPHALYRQLGKTDSERVAAYSELFRQEFERGVIGKIRKATNENFALGNECFAEEIRKILGRRVTPGKAGRPK